MDNSKASNLELKLNDLERKIARLETRMNTKHYEYKAEIAELAAKLDLLQGGKSAKKSSSIFGYTKEDIPYLVVLTISVNLFVVTLTRHLRELENFTQ